MEAGRHNGWFCHAHVLQRIYRYFSTNSYALSLRISCMYMARNHNYPTAVFFLLSIGFYKILIKLLIIIIKTNRELLISINDYELLSYVF